MSVALNFVEKILIDTFVVTISRSTIFNFCLCVTICVGVRVMMISKAVQVLITWRLVDLHLRIGLITLSLGARTVHTAIGVFLLSKQIDENDMKLINKLQVRVSQLSEFHFQRTKVSS